MLFERKKENERILSLFLTAGYPDPGWSAELIVGLAEHGADLIEIGMPFSDPLADGPTIQYSSQVALEQGITMEKTLQIVQDVRAQTDIPLILMGYTNPLISYGVERFCEDAVKAGADGLIISDLPPEESGLLRSSTRMAGLSMIFLVAPNTPDERMRRIDEISDGFIYCVSVTGVTGARDGDEIADSVDRFIERVNRNITRNPTLIGFGIRSRDDAIRISKNVDGFIVGSSLIDLIRESYPNSGWDKKVYSFVKQLKIGNIK